MQQVTEIISKREKKAIAKMKKTYVKSVHNRELQFISMVLVRISGQKGKLQNTWEGPFQVLEHISPSTISWECQNIKTIFHSDYVTLMEESRSIYVENCCS